MSDSGIYLFVALSVGFSSSFCFGFSFQSGKILIVVFDFCEEKGFLKKKRNLFGQPLCLFRRMLEIAPYCSFSKDQWFKRTDFVIYQTTCWKENRVFDFLLDEISPSLLWWNFFSFIFYRASFERFSIMGVHSVITKKKDDFMKMELSKKVSGNWIIISNGYTMLFYMADVELGWTCGQS